MFDLRYSQLLVLEKIFATGSLSQASRQLDITLSAASRALKKCQSVFGDALFVRTYQGMTPTEECRRIMPEVRRLLAGFEHLTHTAPFDPAHWVRTISIAAADNAVLRILRPSLKAIHAAASGVSFRIRPLNESVLNCLADGSLDLAVYPTPILPVLPEHFHSLNLFERTRSCLVRADHPLASKHAAGQPLTQQDFLVYPKIAIALERGSGLPAFEVDNAVSKKQSLFIETPYFLSTPFFLLDSDATLVLPSEAAQFFVDTLKNLAIVPMPETQSGTAHAFTRLVWHERSHSSIEMQWVRSLFVASCAP